MPRYIKGVEGKHAKLHKRSLGNTCHIKELREYMPHYLKEVKKFMPHCIKGVEGIHATLLKRS